MQDMPQTIEITAYSFDELSDKAKEKARDWYREQSTSYDNYVFEPVIDDFITIAEMIGVDFKTHEVKLYGGGTRQKPNIYWSGFCSQGSGACFEGSYTYKPDACAKIREHASDDKELHAIADELAEIQERNLFGLRADITHSSSHYYHSRTMSIDVTNDRDNDWYDAVTEKEIGEMMVSLADWLYSQLDDQNDYINSDEYVDEQITANEYMFDEEGDRHAYA
jgi:hypothetical protein